MPINTGTIIPRKLRILNLHLRISDIIFQRKRNQDGLLLSWFPLYISYCPIIRTCYFHFWKVVAIHSPNSPALFPLSLFWGHSARFFFLRPIFRLQGPGKASSLALLSFFWATAPDFSSYTQFFASKAVNSYERYWQSFVPTLSYHCQRHLFMNPPYPSPSNISR